MTVTGPDFIALQVSDLDVPRSSTRTPWDCAAPRPHLLAPFSSPQRRSPSRFASPCPELISLRLPVPVSGGTLAALRRGSGAARLARGLRNSNPGRSCSQPLRLTFTFADPDGYAVTVHEKASWT